MQTKITRKQTAALHWFCSNFFWVKSNNSTPILSSFKDVYNLGGGKKIYIRKIVWGPRVEPVLKSKPQVVNQLKRNKSTVKMFKKEQKSIKNVPVGGGGGGPPGGAILSNGQYWPSDTNTVYTLDLTVRSPMFKSRCISKICLFYGSAVVYHSTTNRSSKYQISIKYFI